jgi:hypothetical protein
MERGLLALSRTHTMSIRIEQDEKAPTAAVEITIRHPLPDYDLEEVEAGVPRDVDPMLASQGFQDLLDEARTVLKDAMAGGNLELVQLTGAICSERGVHRPGLWLVFREASGPAGARMSQAAQTSVSKVAEQLAARLDLS